MMRMQEYVQVLEKLLNYVNFKFALSRLSLHRVVSGSAVSSFHLYLSGIKHTAYCSIHGRTRIRMQELCLESLSFYVCLEHAQLTTSSLFITTVIRRYGWEFSETPILFQKGVDLSCDHGSHIQSP